LDKHPFVELWTEMTHNMLLPNTSYKQAYHDTPFFDNWYNIEIDG